MKIVLYCYCITSVRVIAQSLFKTQSQFLTKVVFFGRLRSMPRFLFRNNVNFLIFKLTMQFTYTTLNWWPRISEDHVIRCM